MDATRKQTTASSDPPEEQRPIPHSTPPARLEMECAFTPAPIFATLAPLPECTAVLLLARYVPSPTGRATQKLRHVLPTVHRER